MFTAIKKALGSTYCWQLGPPLLPNQILSLPGGCVAGTELTEGVVQ